VIPGRLISRRFAVVFGGVAVLLGGRAFAQINTPPADSRADSQSVGKPSPLTLRTRIPLPGVYGRMDHYGWDSKRGILIVSALGNDTVEIVNSWKRVHTITGLAHPQASVYVPGVDRIVVSSQSGKLRFYDGETYKLLKTLDFGADADTDNIRYDPLSKRVYVGYGRGTRGALAIVDPSSMERMEEFKLGSHPESFQLERDGPRIFVNLPDQEAIGVIDRKTGAVTKWKISGHTNTHAMALDEASHRLFTAALQPGRFTALDTESGTVVASLPCVLGVDDLWFDAARKRIYAPGSGAIDVFQQVDPDRYTVVAHVSVGAGAGSTSLHLKTRTQDSLFMSWPNMLPQGGSEVLLFYVNE
jgi:DNA-binding beta-propeller fold protein YncE